MNVIGTASRDHRRRTSAAAHTTQWTPVPAQHPGVIVTILGVTYSGQGGPSLLAPPLGPRTPQP
eukprot:1186929-Prorocentrum_minimum.AAC.2